MEDDATQLLDVVSLLSLTVVKSEICLRICNMKQEKQTQSFDCHDFAQERRTGSVTSVVT